MSGMDRLNDTVQKSVVGAGITGACAGFGGLAAGPVGMAVGGAVGGVVSATVLSNKQHNIEFLFWFPFSQRNFLIISFLCVCRIRFSCRCYQIRFFAT